MRPAARRLVWIPAAAGLLALVSGALASWAALMPVSSALLTIALARILAALVFRLDRLRWRRLAFRDAVTALLACGGGSAIAAAVCATFPEPWPARLLFVDAAVYPCLALGLAAVPLIRGLRTPPAPAHAARALIWGAGADGRALLERLRHSEPGVEVMGWLDDDPVLAELDCDGLPVLGPIESLPLLAELHGVQVVLAAIPRLSPERRALAEDLAQWSGAQLVIAPTRGALPPLSASSRAAEFAGSTPARRA